MKRYDHKYMFLGLLVVVIAVLATGCASNGNDYQQTQVTYGFYGGYGTGYYDNDIIVNPPPSQPPSVNRPPHASQLPARSVPRPAPRRR